MARAALNQAMGVTGPIDYDVADQTFGPVEGEAQPVATLVDEALRARPDRAALDEQIHAQELARQRRRRQLRADAEPGRRRVRRRGAT